MIRFFRRVAILEGITNLILFLGAVPLKYFFDNPVLVPPVGRIHGAVWIMYMAVMIIALWRRGGMKIWLCSVLAALIPFGSFLNDVNLRKLEVELIRRKDIS